MRGLAAENEYPPRRLAPVRRDARRLRDGRGRGALVLEELEHRGPAARGSTPRCSATAPRTTPTTSPRPSREATACSEMIRAALTRSGIEPEQVDYINAHGTSTPLDDAARDEGDQGRLRRARLRACGLLDQVDDGPLLRRRRRDRGDDLRAGAAPRRLPPTINYEKPDPECDLDYVPNEARHTAGRGRALERDGARRSQRVRPARPGRLEADGRQRDQPAHRGARRRGTPPARARRGRGGAPRGPACAARSGQDRARPLLGSLRQRRARRDAGLDPDEAKLRSADTVERYQQ